MPDATWNGDRAAEAVARLGESARMRYHSRIQGRNRGRGLSEPGIFWITDSSDRLFEERHCEVGCLENESLLSSRLPLASLVIPGI